VLASVRRKGLPPDHHALFRGHLQINLRAFGNSSMGSKTIICSGSAFTHNYSTKIATDNRDLEMSKGNKVGVSRAYIVRAQQIGIGSQVSDDANQLILDIDVRPVNPAGHSHSYDFTHIKGSPVNIGDNVLLGKKATVLKGVSLEKNSIIAVNAQVASGSYAERGIVAGNPARIIGSVNTK
jgi:acetyltransferase-like isoleucine patch superfamily enzyme